MNEIMELHIVSRKLIIYLSKCPKEFISQNDIYTIYNSWSDYSGIHISYINNVKWIYSFIENIKKNNYLDADIVTTLLEDYSK